MGYKSDIEIAQECQMLPITEIAKKAGISDEYLEQYGKYKAKIDYKLLKDSKRDNGKLILVTAMNPTPAGEGALPGTCLWYQGRRSRRRLCTGSSHGGYQPALHR